MLSLKSLFVSSCFLVTVARASDICDYQWNRLESCGSRIGASDSEINSCLSCFQNAIPSSAYNCADIENQFCRSFSYCGSSSCDSCADEVIDVFDCLIDYNPNFPDCYVDCNGFDFDESDDGGFSAATGKKFVELGSLSILVGLSSWLFA